MGSDFAGAAGAVVEFDDELLAHATLYIDPHGLGHTDQRRGDQDLEVFVTQSAIRSQVLVFGVGIDRYLSNLASTNGLDEVDRHGATALVEQRCGFLCHLDLHETSNSA